VRGDRLRVGPEPEQGLRVEGFVQMGGVAYPRQQYTGNPFTAADGPCTASDFVSGTIQLSAALQYVCRFPKRRQSRGKLDPYGGATGHKWIRRNLRLEF
jgi:hypothetical protein